MKNVKKIFLVAALVGIACVPAARAMEVTAGSGVDVQANWSALKALVTGVGSRVDVVSTTLGIVQGDVTHLQNEVTTLQNNVTTLQNNVTNLTKTDNSQQACAQQGGLWTGTACRRAAADCSLQTTQVTYCGNGNGASGCPSGYAATGPAVNIGGVCAQTPNTSYGTMVLTCARVVCN